MLVNGKKIKEMVKVHWLLLMVTNMLVNGNKTKEMVKVN